MEEVEGAAPEQRRRRRLRPPSPRRVLRSPAFPWALAAAAVAVAVAFGALWWGERAKEARAAEVRETGRRFASALTTFSADTIERDVAEIRSYAVGRFADEVEQTFDEARIEAIRASEARSVGRVRTVFVQELGEDAATVFAVVDETVVNAEATAPRIDVLRMEIGLLETDEGWRVERVEILQTPGGFPID